MAAEPKPCGGREVVDVLGPARRDDGRDHVGLAEQPGERHGRGSRLLLARDLVERRLVELGVDILARHRLKAVDDGAVELVETLKGATIALNGTLVSVTARLPRDELHHALVVEPDALAGAGIQSIRRVGDCHGPATIAAAVYEGHRYARELDTKTGPDAMPFKRERVNLDSH